MDLPSGNKPICYVLVGLPGSGKTTWAKEQDYQSFSSDHYVEVLSAGEGLTYSEGFIKHIKEASTLFRDSLDSAITARLPFIWDQTNLTITKRTSIISRLEKSYYMVCVCFEEDSSILKERRGLRQEKHIPEEVIKRMEASYERPERDEGFNALVFIESFLLSDPI